MKCRMGHSIGTFYWDILLGHSIGTFYWDILLGHSIGTFYWDILLGHSIGTFYWDILLGHSIGTFYWDILSCTAGDPRIRNSSCFRRNLRQGNLKCQNTPLIVVLGPDLISAHLSSPACVGGFAIYSVLKVMTFVEYTHAHTNRSRVPDINLVYWCKDQRLS